MDTFKSVFTKTPPVETSSPAAANQNVQTKRDPNDHFGRPIVSKGYIAGLDPQTDALLRKMGSGHSYFVSEIMRYNRGNGDLAKLVRLGLIAKTDLYGSYNRKTATTEDRYTITPKGQKAIGADTMHEAYQSDQGQSQNQTGAKPQGQPQGQPQAAVKAPPASNSQQTQQAGQASPQAAQQAPQTSGSQAPKPNIQTTPSAQPSANDNSTAKQIADKLKAAPNSNPANLDGDIQKSLVAMGKGGSNSQNMTNLVKQQMGVTESKRGRNK